VPELVWEGKYDADGKRVAPLKVALPFQTVETVNESAQERQRSLFFDEPQGTDWRNRLIWGDKKYVLPALLEEFAGKIDLVYIDPPFATGDDFSTKIHIGRDGVDDFLKAPSMIEQKAYRDTWGRGSDTYLGWFADAAAVLHDLLSPTGSLFVHLDWHVGHYVKVVLDEIFGTGAGSGDPNAPGFRNEVVWCYSGGGVPQREMPRKHDTIFWYSKSSAWTFNTQYRPYSEGTVQRGRTAVKGPNAELRAEGTPINDWWPDVKKITSPTDPEKLYYETQKSEELLGRIIGMCSNPGDLVLDCFIGSGTTATTSEKMGRRWIAADLGRFAIHTTRKRLLATADVKPFIVQNLGKYERQLWQESEFGPSATSRTAAYRKFILDLYHARPVAGYAWLHGLKSGRMVHVGTVDAPVTVGDVKQVVAEFRKAIGTGKGAPTSKGVDLLGWDFAFELNEVARQDAEKAGIDLRLIRIPREVLEKRAVEQGDIRFFELAALSVGKKKTGRKVTLTLEDFIIPLDDVPADVQKAVTHWSQWIDYWAVDWDNKGDAFHNEWQSYRTKKENKLVLAVDHQYEEPGEYTVVIKVIDILGNDTTKALTLKVGGRG
jgi:DNA modification methylase